MAKKKLCPKCQAPLPADAPAGICPRCLMEKALESTVGHGGPRGRLPEPGETFGPYEIGQRLRSGGMGAVYAARNVNSGRRVTLKVLNHRLESTEHRQRFLREGRGSRGLGGAGDSHLDLFPGSLKSRSLLTGYLESWLSAGLVRPRHGVNACDDSLNGVD